MGSNLTKGMGIATRLILMNLLLVTLFAVMSVLAHYTFAKVERLVGTSVGSDVKQNMANARMLRELAAIFSQTDQLLGNFLKNEKVLEKQSRQVVAAVERLGAESSDRRLTLPLQAYARRLDTLFEVCTGVNTALRQVEQLEQRLHGELDALEQTISDAKIALVLKGLDPVIMDQLTVLTAGFQDSLQSINLLFFRSISDKSTVVAAARHKQLLTMIDDFTLQLQALTASEPQIAAYAPRVVASMRTYRAMVDRYYLSMEELQRQSRQLEEAKAMVNGIMQRMDEELAVSSSGISRHVHDIMVTSRRGTQVIAVVSVLASGIAAIFFILSVIRRPMAQIIKGIEGIAAGNLDTRINLNRNDEWSHIETALNRMAGELKQSYLELERSNHELQAEILEHRQTEENLRRAKEYTENLIQGASVIVVGLDVDGCVNLFNQTAEMITGYSPGDLVGKEWCEAICPRERFPEVHAEFERLRESAIVGTFENQFLTKHGKTRTISWRNNPIIEDGVVVGTLLFGMDLTEHRTTEEQLQQSQKMEAIGRLAGGVAHDFNNMLGVILGYAELSMLTVAEGSKLRRNLVEISKAAQRSRDITRQLLAFSRKEVIAPQPTNLNTLIVETEKTLGRLIGEDIDLAFRPAQDLWTVKVDPSQIDQILMNLAVNARDAMPDGGRLSIETSNIRIDESYCQYQLDAQPGDFVRIAVSDTGIGMDDETQRHIFEPFFTTKEVGKGTGLGLATTFGIVKQNNGFIQVYSEPGHGSTFNIYLPSTAESAVAPPSHGEKPPAGAGAVLVVEDDKTVLTMSTMMLEEIGYTVHATGDPQEAIALCRDPGTVLDMILSDVIMPAMSGKEMVEQILQVRPAIKVLYMSGYTSDIIAQKGVLEEGMHFIHKPFDMHTLHEKIKETLNG
ncbi:response regulator [Geobacter sp. FeAm09]|uniref:ATP-binding protein n=1 Tax=Geobacter sp. FeAm09 TaxID=2597769 RepID=UPI0011EE7DBC|nr:ATP-binding protein [Geobacter sp. FeAm09]QEM70040.1 response regulator [Geobacter sp. FeAm09]